MKYIWHQPSWPEFHWENADLIKKIGTCRFQQGSLLTQMKDLGFDVRQRARAEVLIEEALKTDWMKWFLECMSKAILSSNQLLSKLTPNGLFIAHRVF